MPSSSGRRRLATLAQLLDARGWNSRIVVPSGVPLLEVLDPQGVALVPEHVTCEREQDDGDWYRWRQKGVSIAPADQPEAAAEEIIRTLTPKGKP